MAKRGLVLALALLGGCSETFEHQFPSSAQALQSQSFKGGWLPQWLPKGATDIRDKYNIDTNITLVRFSFTPDEAPPFNSGCTPAGKPLAAPGLGADWWPRDLEGSIGTHRYVFFDCPNDKGGLAVLTRDHLAYFWRHGS